MTETDLAELARMVKQLNEDERLHAHRRPMKQRILFRVSLCTVFVGGCWVLGYVLKLELATKGFEFLGAALVDKFIVSLGE
jgi:hypothetical protein